MYVAAAARGRGVGRSCSPSCVAGRGRAASGRSRPASSPRTPRASRCTTAADSASSALRERLGQHHGVWRDVLLVERRSDGDRLTADSRARCSPRRSAPSRSSSPAAARSWSTPRRDALGHVGVAISFGLVIMVMIYAIGHISGAHFNPAVTLAFALTRHFPWTRVAAYWARPARRRARRGARPARLAGRRRARRRDPAVRLATARRSCGRRC